MPINYEKYPPNWRSEIRPSILERAGHKCEFCRAIDRSTIKRIDVRHHEVSVCTHKLSKPEMFKGYLYDPSCEVSRPNSDKVYYLDERGYLYESPIRLNDYDRFSVKPTKIILTIAHLDHDPENWDVRKDRLAALCQKCHLSYDKATREEQNKRVRNAMMWGLFQP